MLALLPMAATWGRGPPPKLPPSKQRDTWGVMASYTKYAIYRRGWVGQDYSRNKQSKADKAGEDGRDEKEC